MEIPKRRVETIQDIDFEVVPFAYLLREWNDDSLFILLDSDIEKYKGKNVLFGEIYIIIPSYIEMQDLYHFSSEKNIQTNKYELNYDWLKLNKLNYLCHKIVDHNKESHPLTGELIDNMYPNLANFIILRINEVIGKYYSGMGLTKEREDQLKYKCFNYYKAVNRKEMGYQGIIVPPPPGAVLLASVCEMFQCTPTEARRINKKDLDYIMLAKSQESFCSNPDNIGGTSEKIKQNGKHR